MQRSLVSILMGIFLLLLNSTYAWAADTNIGESNSHEIQFCIGGVTPYVGCAAVDLRAQADALATPVAIYEYVRNNYDYSLYHGARSGAINTFLGGRGDDVDLAAMLIAMLRSQGTPAQYVVGTIRVPTTQVMNWLSVENPDLAYSLLRDQGIQKVVLAADKSTIDFEHVWVEALVPYANYRGVGPKTIDCNATPSLCNWVPLDPSFKQRGQRASGLDPYSSLIFDYTSYYNAIKNNDAARRDKNPLEIYQEQVLAWLRTNAPGKTLQDIPDFTDIIAESDGLLPASLPFVTVGSLRRYNSAALHDVAFPATESKKWMKYVTATVTIYQGGIPIINSGATVSLVDASIQRFTLSFLPVGTDYQQMFRLGGNRVGGVISMNGNGLAIGNQMPIVVSMDGAPAPDASGTDETISATYKGILGGYYLIATGGETSNWSQVHRAAQQLLAANQQYKIVFNPADPGSNGQACDQVSGLNCTPYVDANNNGWDATDLKLLNSPVALDALTGGLLYSAGTQYYANLRDKMAQLDAINKIKSPISGFLGVVSTTYDVEYIDGTAFSVLPGGLLIDMKGIHVTGDWRIDQAASYSNKQFELIGHIVSSLEHETWQELTGYDAVSTVRGIQVALANGATLVDAQKSQTSDTMAAAYTAFGFTSGAAPTGFTYTPFNLFGTQPATWTNTTYGNGAAFDTMLAQVSTSTATLRQYSANYSYLTNKGLYGWVNCVNSQATQLLGYINAGSGSSTFTTASTMCDGTSYATSYTISQLYAALQTDYMNTIIPIYIGQSYLDYFDITQGFSPASYVYRITTPFAVDAQFTSFVQTIRDNLYMHDITQFWVEYILPSKQSVGPNYKFSVDIRKAYDTPSGNLNSATFEILNNTGVAAGGGYVSALPLTPTQSVPATKKE